MKKSFPILALVSLVTACQIDPQGPYPTGLTVTTEATETRVTRSYLVREGDPEPKERKGTLGFGADCNEARASSGQTTLTEEGTSVETWRVIGQTESSHPLVPGTASYGSVGVSVVEATASFSGRATSHETFRDPNSAPESWEDTTQSDVARATDAAYRGISADEYVVGLSSLGDLWSSLGDLDAAIDVDLITRRDAQASDIWSSVDGEMLYLARASEELTVAGEKLSAMRVDVLTVGDPDPAAGDLVEKCIARTVTDYVTTHPDLENGSIETAVLDVGCDSAFVHQELGSEWWYGNVLVQAQKEQYEVAISGYGYERFEDNGAGCARVTSATKDADDATLYVEYSVTTITTDLHTTQYEILDEE